MRIAIYAPVFVRPTETFIYDAATELARACEQVSVITAKRELSDERPFEPVCVVPQPKRWDYQRLLHRARAIFSGQSGGDDARTAVQRTRIKRVLQKVSPDVVLANYGQGGVTIAPVAEELDIPLLVSFHGADASRLARDPVWQSRYRQMFRTAAAVTGPSNYVRDKLIKLGSAPERTHVLHYGIKTDQIACRLPRARFDGTEVRFLFIGRLADKKDPLTLLKSFKLAREKLLPLTSTLTIVGDGPLRNRVDAAISELHIGQHVRMLGSVSHDEVIKQFGLAHIYVQHSVTAPDGDEEGLPVSITESLAAGLPVVSTRHSGIPEAVLEGVCGYLVDEGDYEGMSEKMVELAQHPERWDEFGRNGRELLEKEFAMDTVQSQLRQLLSMIIGS